MPINLAVLAVGQRLLPRRPCGLIADRLSIQKATAANGKSFITVVSVKRLGGPGVAIVRQQNGAAPRLTKILMSIPLGFSLS